MFHVYMGQHKLNTLMAIVLIPRTIISGVFRGVPMVPIEKPFVPDRSVIDLHCMSQCNICRHIGKNHRLLGLCGISYLDEVHVLRCLL